MSLMSMEDLKDDLPFLVALNFLTGSIIILNDIKLELLAFSCIRTNNTWKDLSFHFMWLNMDKYIASTEVEYLSLKNGIRLGDSFVLSLL